MSDSDSELLTNNRVFSFQNESTVSIFRRSPHILSLGHLILHGKSYYNSTSIIFFCRQLVPEGPTLVQVI